MNDTLWVYWQPHPKIGTPPIVTLCLESIRRHNPTMCLLDDRKVAALGGEKVLQATEKRGLVKRADLLRLWLLKTLGGAWLDADYICFQPVTTLQAIQEEGVEFAAIGPEHNVSNNAIASRAGGRFVSEAYDEALALLHTGERLGYLRIGPSLMTSRYHRYGKKGAIRILPRPDYANISWFRTRQEFMQVGTDRQFENSKAWRPTAVAQHLCGACFERYAHWTRYHLLTCRQFICFMFRKAFGHVWIGRSREILKRLPLHTPLVGAEVGVRMAENARLLLQQRPLLTLHAIDLWKHNPSPDYAATRDMNANPAIQWEPVYQAARKRLQLFGQRVIIHRKDSVEAAQDIPDNSLDFVFIDGDHSRSGVSRDIAAYVPKLKPNGLLCGHDYKHPGKRFAFEVTGPVDEFAHQHGLTVETGRDVTWFIRLTA